MNFVNSTFYQIYPLGFTGAPHQNDFNYNPRIKKLISWIPYFKKLGIDSIILNPIFQSEFHGYDTIDFKNIDSRLGNKEDFKQVCQKLHEENINIILDGVFNHVGREFTAFKDVREKKAGSKYKDWFYIDFNGNSAYNDGFYYEGWEGHYNLVKLNLQNPDVKNYIKECIQFYIDYYDIDGFRLDVAYLLDHNFIREIRHFVKSIKPEFILIGEVLFGDYNLIVNDDMLDSCTNYECYKGLFSSFNSMNLFEIAHSLQRQFGYEQWCLYKNKYLLNFADNHDVSRVYSILNDKNHIKPLYGILFAMPGIPCIYYGSEWKEEGLKQPDNDHNLRPYFEDPKPNELTDFIEKLIKIKRKNPELSTTTYKNILITNRQLIFERRKDEEVIYLAVNAEDKDFTANCGELNGEFTELIENINLQLEGQIKLEPYCVKYLKKKI